MVADPAQWRTLPAPVVEWLALQTDRSSLPGRDDVLVETFPRRSRHFLVAYPFEGRLAHQTLGMLLTRRLDRIGARPLGFVANDYGLAVWGLEDLSARIANGTLEPRRSLRAGHAGRRSRRLARREQPDEAHVPQRRR